MCYLIEAVPVFMAVHLLLSDYRVMLYNKRSLCHRAVSGWVSVSHVRALC